MAMKCKNAVRLILAEALLVLLQGSAAVLLLVESRKTTIQHPVKRRWRAAATAVRHRSWSRSGVEVETAVQAVAAQADCDLNQNAILIHIILLVVHQEDHMQINYGNLYPSEPV